MPDPITALGGAAFSGFANVREVGPVGMITLRCKADAKGFQQAISLGIGTEIPRTRQIVHGQGRSVAWMSPDEYLLILPYAETGHAMEIIAQTMTGVHHLAVVVSDARSVFHISGAKADQLLAKLAPVDFETLPAGELRRTRLAQVAAAFWRDEDGFTLVCFRSVARYVYDLLAVSGVSQSELYP